MRFPDWLPRFRAGPDLADNESDEAPKRRRFNPARWRKEGGRLFWVWVAYQAIKGMLTLTLIWIPLFLVWLRSNGGS